MSGALKREADFKREIRRLQKQRDEFRNLPGKLENANREVERWKSSSENYAKENGELMRANTRLTEDRDYFKAAYSRKLDDEKRALEAAQAAVAENTRLREGVAAIVRKKNLREISGWSCAVCHCHVEDSDGPDATRHWPGCPIPTLEALLGKPSGTVPIRKLPALADHIVVTVSETETHDAPAPGSVAVDDGFGAFCFFADLEDLEALLAHARALLTKPAGGAEQDRGGAALPSAPIAHAFIPAPYYPDRCDRKVDDHGRPRTCARPQREHGEVKP